MIRMTAFETFETTMMDNFIIFNFALAVVNVVLSGHLAQRLKSGLALSVVGFFISIAISVIAAAIAVDAIAAFISPRFLGVAVNDLPGFVAWSLETAPEYGSVGIIAGIAGYVVIRMRRRLSLA
ncbi:hypothetical protein [Mesorhizobium sp.]|uniref:hypothetical protein n=1 Tax=Mesorhizobium sp. TaxID=1871066 RepID=UPI000FE2FDCC|nr:hypothetical protein [Mesorhizobium sp.]RWN59379.1 MAG: hypothetical protein EOR98_03110 [Mesorhizobium sp.]RWN80885.1 MAG: hypothetical protein EOS02_03105 [Mesorhizobium sp.]RWN83328.1 MAG: hypothetical protein EOS01_03235 [Mesorhizobium sp.]RWN86766.1 MAG: hypothetical protein EOS04_17875 [Mesorhizobium sp.]RWO16401.1 MAG: hypothetical protein EOS15_05270 [Mesorhizobium sp.]